MQDIVGPNDFQYHCEVDFKCLVVQLYWEHGTNNIGDCSGLHSTQANLAWSFGPACYICSNAEAMTPKYDGNCVKLYLEVPESLATKKTLTDYDPHYRDSPTRTPIFWKPHDLEKPGICSLLKGSEFGSRPQTQYGNLPVRAPKDHIDLRILGVAASIAWTPETMVSRILWVLWPFGPLARALVPIIGTTSFPCFKDATYSRVGTTSQKRTVQHSRCLHPFKRFWVILYIPCYH